MQSSAQHYPSAAEVHTVADAFHAVDDASRGEIGGFYMQHQFLDGNLAVVDKGNAAFDHLGEVVRHYVGSHADGDTAGAIYKQLGDAGGEYGGLFERVVEIELEIDGFLLDVRQHHFR